MDPLRPKLGTKISAVNIAVLPPTIPLRSNNLVLFNANNILPAHNPIKIIRRIKS